jgi:hypothetical protein
VIELALVALGRRDPGLGHYLRWGSLLLLTIVFVAVWLFRMWKHAPDPEERWRRHREEDAEARSFKG